MIVSQARFKYLEFSLLMWPTLREMGYLTDIVSDKPQVVSCKLSANTCEYLFSSPLSVSDRTFELEFLLWLFFFF